MKRCWTQVFTLDFTRVPLIFPLEYVCNVG